MLRANNVSSAIKAETKKVLFLFEGPYRIKKSVSTDTYILVNDKTGKERGMFHASHLKLYNQPVLNKPDLKV